MLCHPIAHNILLLTLTPSYRSKIINLLKHISFWKRCYQGRDSQPTTSVVPNEPRKTRLGQMSSIKI